VDADSVPSSSGGVQLERPQEVIGCSERASDGVDFVDQILNADDVVFLESSLNDSIVSDSNSIVSLFGESTLVDQFPHGLEAGGSVSHIRLDEFQHLAGSLVDSNEYGIVDLTESEQLQDLAGLGVQVVDTSNSNNQNELGFRLNEEGVIPFGSSSHLNERLLFSSVLGNILLSSTEKLSFLEFSSINQGLGSVFGVEVTLLTSLSLFQQNFRNWGLTLRL
jgi:hypothetical protein